MSAKGAQAGEPEDDSFKGLCTVKPGVEPSPATPMPLRVPPIGMREGATVTANFLPELPQELWGSAPHSQKVRFHWLHLGSY